MHSNWSEEINGIQQDYFEKWLGLHTADDEDFRQWMDRQKTSHEKIKEVCTKYGESVMIERSEYYKRILYDPKTKLLFCRHAKVGTTTWLAHFLSLHEESNKRYDASKSSIGMLHERVPELFPLPADNSKEIRQISQKSKMDLSIFAFY